MRSAQVCGTAAAATGFHNQWFDQYLFGLVRVTTHAVRSLRTLGNGCRLATDFTHFRESTSPASRALRHALGSMHKE